MPGLATIEIIRRADSAYAGMTLDTGNFRPPKVYDQIEMSIPYAVNTHIKTEVANDDGKTRSPADWDRIFKMFAAPGTAAPVEGDGAEVFGVSSRGYVTIAAA